MTYVAGNPVTGFTLTLDGDIEAVEAILQAALKELGKQWNKAEREYDEVFWGEPWGFHTIHIPHRPVTGKFELRTHG